MSNEVDRAIVDHFVRTKGAAELNIGGGARCCNVAAESFGNLNAECSGAARACRPIGKEVSMCPGN